jgi:hypothetical protein
MSTSPSESEAFEDRYPELFLDAEAANEEDDEDGDYEEDEEDDDDDMAFEENDEFHGKYFCVRWCNTDTH